MWSIVTSVISMVSSGKKTYIAAAIALLASLGWGYYEMTRADGFEAQIQLYQQQLESAKTLDELNKQRALDNQATLESAIKRQNEMFDNLAKLTSDSSQKVLASIEKNQATTTAQYNKVAQSIGQIKITSCEGMMEELIKFPHDSNLQWNSK